jgi:hypothetical protein
MTDLHCWSRDVHWPEAHLRPLPQLSPSGVWLSAGQTAALPGQVSWGSQSPELSRQTVLELAYWQLRQQSSLESSQTELPLYLQVEASQQGLSPQPCSPPQSHCSSPSTMPLPHCWPVMVSTSLLLLKQSVLTLLFLIALQMLPIVQGENSSTPL